MTEPILLMTRPIAAAERFVARLVGKPKVLFSPLIEIVPTGVTPDLSADKGVIFTSANAVPLAPPGKGRLAYCVGHRTADCASQHGWQVSRTELDAQALTDSLCKDPVPGPLAHLAGAHRRGDIAAKLSGCDMPTDVHVLYDQQTRPLTTEAIAALSGEAPVILPLFSPRTAAQFASQIRTAACATVIVMSDAVAAALAEVRVAKVIRVEAPTGDMMAQAVENLL